MTPRYPAAVWIPSPNENQAAIVHPVLGVVFHTVAGIGLPGQYFAHPASQVSSHFGIGFDGRVEQYVDIDSVAWAEGFEANHRYWSIEFEDGGNPSTPMSWEQLAAAGKVIAWLWNQGREFAIQAAHAYGEQGVIGHVEVWPAGGHSCPDPVRLAQKPALLMATIAALTPPSPTEAEVQNLVIIHDLTSLVWRLWNTATNKVVNFTGNQPEMAAWTSKGVPVVQWPGADSFNP